METSHGIQAFVEALAYGQAQVGVMEGRLQTYKKTYYLDQKILFPQKRLRWKPIQLQD